MEFLFWKKKSCFLDRSPFDWSRVIYKWTSFPSNPASTIGIGFKRSYNSNMGCLVRSHRFYIRRSSWTSRWGKLFRLLLVTSKIILQVLSCDFQPTGNQIASCGMDHSILIWDISSERAKLGMSLFNFRLCLIILFSNKSRISFQVEQLWYTISDSNASPNFLNTWYSFQLHRLY